MTDHQRRMTVTKPLSQKDRDAMMNLTDYGERSFKSKPVLRTMQSLYERGLIEFDPFAAKAVATPAGILAMAAIND